MKKIVDVDMEINCKKASTAIKNFFKKYPNLDYWKEELEYMAENNIDFMCDNELADGTKNENWTWALHFDIEENYCYIAIIERA
jgi:hypothetical protein